MRPAGSGCSASGLVGSVASCGAVAGTNALLLQPQLTAKGAHKGYFSRCLQDFEPDQLRTCRLGDLQSPTRRVALLGDSHAVALTPMFDFAARSLSWEVTVHAKASCPFSEARRVLPGEVTTGLAQACDTFNDRALAAVLGDPGVTDVFITQRASAYEFVARPGTTMAEPAVDGFASMWTALARDGRRVHVIREVPTMSADVPGCLERFPTDAQPCGVARANLPPDGPGKVVTELADPAITLLDLTPYLCDDTWCYARIGDTAVYQDTTHLSYEYARLLAPQFARLMAAIG